METQNTTAETQTVEINAAADIKPAAIPVNTVAQIPAVQSNNLVNTGVILGTAVLTFAVGSGVYWAINKVADIIRKHDEDENAEQDKKPEVENKVVEPEEEPTEE